MNTGASLSTCLLYRSVSSGRPPPPSLELPSLSYIAPAKSPTSCIPFVATLPQFLQYMDLHLILHGRKPDRCTYIQTSIRAHYHNHCYWGASLKCYIGTVLLSQGVMRLCDVVDTQSSDVRANASPQPPPCLCFQELGRDGLH